MASSIARRPKTRKRPACVRPSRRRQAQRQLDHTLAATITDAVRQAVEQALQDEITALLGRARSQRRSAADPTVVSARCNRCGTGQRRCFFRAGRYLRSLLTLTCWCPIRVPRVSCVCGGMVDVEFTPLVPYGRHWGDVAERTRELAGLCVSLRDSAEILAWQNGQPLAISTLNGLVTETATLAAAFHAGPLDQVPAVVMLDGLWVTLLEPTGEAYQDRRGRRRQRQRARRLPLLLAYGVDPVAGMRWVLDWEPGQAEDAASWTTLLERLHARGLHQDRGLELVVHDGAAGLEQALETVHFGLGVLRQRCIFHKLRNVCDAVQGAPRMDRPARRARRAAVRADAQAVYQGQTATEIRRRLAAFRHTWQAREPAAVATLERDFDRTLAYLAVVEDARMRGLVYQVRWVRTTSPLERLQRHLRQKVRQVTIFHAEAGMCAAIELVLRRRQLTTPLPLHQPWVQRLEEALLAA